MKPQKLLEANIRNFDREIETSVRHLMLKGSTKWTRDSTVATLFGTGMPKASILIREHLEYIEVEENLKDYWEKDIKKVRVEYRADFVVVEPEKDSDIEEIESPTASKGKEKRGAINSPILVKKRRVYLVFIELIIDCNCCIGRGSRGTQCSTSF